LLYATIFSYPAPYSLVSFIAPQDAQVRSWQYKPALIVGYWHRRTPGEAVRPSAASPWYHEWKRQFSDADYVSVWHTLPASRHPDVIRNRFHVLQKNFVWRV